MEISKISGENPFARFGHTMNSVSKSKFVLFGGATGDSGKYSITNDSYLFETSQLLWKKLAPSGAIPSPRAAHSACSIELLQLIVYGGATGGGGLASDELYLLDLKSGEDKCQWVLISVIGTTPGRRYGHSMVFCKPFILVFAGNTGNEPVNDVWSLNLEKSPFSWAKIDCSANDYPMVRVYHAASLCVTGSANGMMVVFGGRTADQSALNDTWGLRRHRDGKWDWVRAPYKNNEKPSARYQHSTIFSGSLMLVVGGRTNQVGESVPLEIYDTESSDWFKFLSIPRFRHCIWLYETGLFVHGGFDQETPNVPTDKMMQIDLEKLLKNHPNLVKSSGFATRDVFNPQGIPHPRNVNPAANQQPSHRLSNPKIASGDSVRESTTSSEIKSKNEIMTAHLDSAGSAKSKDQKAIQIQNIRLSPQAIIATIYGPEDNLNNIVSKISIDKLQEESKKLGIGFHDPLVTKPSAYYEGLYNLFINLLLIPKEYSPDYRFNMKKELILKLCEEVQKILVNEGQLLKVRSPIKIFGNIHGQFGDLMKIFDNFGTPSDAVFEGDIDSIDYLFLGDYVDRGFNSIEVVVLLFALKLKYPDQIHLLRGHHEDKVVNRIYGFAEECSQKFNEDITDPNSLFQRINKVFEYLPLAAIIDSKFFCCHGGIGNSLRYLDEIEKIPKPFEIQHLNENAKNSYLQKLVNELLWCDPTLSNEDGSESGNDTNACRGILGLEEFRCKRFSLERIKKFLDDNALSLVIRSHEMVKDGFEMLNDRLITVVSCLDYCGKYQNAGGILKIKKNFEIIPKIIYPSGGQPGKWNEMEEKKKDGKGGSSIAFNDIEIKIRKMPSSPMRTKPGNINKKNL